MAENGEDCTLYQPCKVPVKGNSRGLDSRTSKTFVGVKSTQEHNDDRTFVVGDEGGEVTAYLSHPPEVHRLSKLSKKSVSLEATSRTWRLRNSQESLSDRAETGSSTDSLKEDQSGVSDAGTVRNEQDSCVRPRSVITTGSPVFEDRKSSLSEYGRKPHSQVHVLERHLKRSAKVRLSPVQPTGPSPALEKNVASTLSREANRIDKDCSDNAIMVKEKTEDGIHRNRSDSRLQEAMEDSASVNSIKSLYSILSPIKPEDVRNR